jgi:hypothetical protein
VSAPSRNGGVQEHLLGRLYCSGDLSEALSILFDSVLSPAGIEYAVVLVRRKAELRGVVGMGWEDRVVRAYKTGSLAAESTLALTIVREASSPGELATAGQAEDVPDPNGHRRDCTVRTNPSPERTG